jgi:hypothetical protein
MFSFLSPLTSLKGRMLRHAVKQVLVCGTPASLSISLALLLDFYGMSMVFLWDSYGISKGKSVESKLKSVETCFQLIS